MIRFSLYMLVMLAIFTIAKGFWTGEMNQNTTLYEVGVAMKDYRIQIIEGINDLAKNNGDTKRS